jgi:hypothetical protein
VNKIPLGFLFEAGYKLFGATDFVNLFQLATLWLVGAVFFVVAFTEARRRSVGTKVAACAAMLGSLIYALNPWTLDRVNNHIFMLLGMAFSPLLFAVFFRMIEKPFAWKRAIAAGAVLAFVSLLSSHNIFYLVPLTCALGLAMFIAYPETRRSLLPKFAVVGLVYLVLSAFWILPLLAKSTAGNIKPSYNLTFESFERLSLRNTSSNILQMVGGGAWRPLLNSIPALGLGVLFGFAGIAAATAGLYVYRRSKIVLILGVFFVLFLLLSMGTNAPLPFFQWLFDSPLRNIAWLYRDPSRFLQFLVLIIAILVTLFAVFALGRMKTIRGGKYLMPVYGLMVAVVMASPASYSLLSLGSNTLIGSELPKDYWQVAEFLKQDNHDDSKALWLPMKGYYFYNWNNALEVAGDIYTMSSPVPTYTLSTSAGSAAAMNQFIYNKVIVPGNTQQLGQILQKSNVKYLVVHRDLIGTQQREAERVTKVLSSQKDLAKAYETSNYTVFKVVSSWPAVYGLSKNDFDKATLKSISELPEVPLDLKTRAKWSTSDSKSTLALSSGAPIWRVNVSEKTSQAGATLQTDDVKLDAYDILKFSILPDGRNTGKEMNMVVTTTAGTYIFNRYNLVPGEWNDIELNFRRAEQAQSEDQTDSTENVLRSIEFGIYRQTQFGTYYEPGVNAFQIKDLKLSFDDEYGKYDPVALLAAYRDVSPQTLSAERGKDSVHVQGAGGNVVVLAESYDPAWQAVVDSGGSKTVIKSQPAYGVVNAFDLTNVPKGSTVELKFKPFPALIAGLGISIAAWLAIIGAGLSALGTYLYMARRPSIPEAEPNRVPAPAKIRRRPMRLG